MLRSRHLLAGVVGLLLASDATARGGIVFEPSAALVVASPYGDTINGGAGDWRGGDGAELLTYLNRHRIRQTGSIEEIRLYVCDPQVEAFKVRIWRQNAQGRFDLVDSTEDLAAYFDRGEGLYTVSLSNPLHAQEGDFVGYYMAGDRSFLQTQSSSYYASYLVRGEATGVDVDFLGAFEARYPNYVTLDLLTQAPSFVFIGDSLIQGAPAHRSFLVNTLQSNVAGTLEHQFGQISGYSYQNMGIGSQTSGQIAARFEADAVGLSPRAVVIMAGINDVAVGVALTTYVENMRRMFDQSVAAGIVPVVLKLFPWSNGSNQQMQAWEQYNAALESLVAEYVSAVYVDANDVIGQPRPGGPPGNLWDIRPEYNADGVHLTSQGYGAVAEVLHRAIASRYGFQLRWDACGDGDWSARDPQTGMARWVATTGQPVSRPPGDTWTSAVIGDGGVRLGESVQLAELKIEGGSLLVGAQAALEVEGSIVVGERGSLRLEIEPGAKHAAITASRAILEGALDLGVTGSLRSGPADWGNRSLSILEAEAIEGAFEALPPLGASLGHGAFFRGITYASDRVMVEVFQAADGDVNGDGMVDASDVQAILREGRFGQPFDPQSPAGWTMGDFTGDGWVTTADIQAMLTANLFGKGIYAEPFSGTRALTVVPEPSSLALLWLAAIGGAMGAAIGRRRSAVSRGR